MLINIAEDSDLIMPQDPKKDFLAQIEDTTDPYYKSVLERVYREQIDVENPIPIETKINVIKQKIASSSPEEIVYSFLPHEMAKIPIFFPMSDKELKTDRRLLHTMTTESKWGMAEIRGIKLSLFEEDVLLALIRMAKDDLKPTNKELVLDTSLAKIVRFLFGKKGYGNGSYKSISGSLKNLGLIGFTLYIYAASENGFGKKVSREISVSAIIPHYNIDHTTGRVVIKFNPDFFSYLSESSLTNINFTLRRRLKKSGSKALIRFLSTHRNLSRLNLLTVLNAINFNVKQPKFALRRYLKECFNELKKVGVLGPKAKLYPDDTVFFDVNTRILKPRKSLPK